MVVSGSSVRRSVLPGWPFCPPVLLPDVSRRLLVRAGFLFSPSLDGGLPLLPLFRPRRRSSSATRAVSAAMTSRCATFCSSNVAMISRSAAASPDGALSSGSEWESDGGNDIESLTHAPSRLSSADQRPDTWAVTPMVALYVRGPLRIYLLSLIPGFAFSDPSMSSRAKRG